MFILGNKYDDGDDDDDSSYTLHNIVSVTNAQFLNRGEPRGNLWISSYPWVKRKQRFDLSNPRVNSG